MGSCTPSTTVCTITCYSQCLRRLSDVCISMQNSTLQQGKTFFRGIKASISLRDLLCRVDNLRKRVNLPEMLTSHGSEHPLIFAEAVVRGHKSGLLSTSDYNNLSQCETLDDVKLHLVSFCLHLLFCSYLLLIPARLKLSLNCLSIITAQLRGCLMRLWKKVWSS